MDIGEIVHLNNRDAGHGSMLCNLPRKIHAHLCTSGNGRFSGCEWKEYIFLYEIDVIETTPDQNSPLKPQIQKTGHRKFQIRDFQPPRNFQLPNLLEGPGVPCPDSIVQTALRWSLNTVPRAR